jgi:hypothetical protein
VADIFGRFPQILRALLSLGFGIFWGYIAYSIGPLAGPSTQIGVGCMSIVAILFGVIGLIRSTTPSGERTSKSIGTFPAETGGLDVDAIMERYLAQKNGR